MATPTISIPRDNIDNVFIEALTWGTAWDLSNSPNRTLTYSFDTGHQISGWSNAEKELVREALQTWSNVADINFVEVPYVNVNLNSNQADIVYLKGNGSTLSSYFGFDISSIDGYHDVPGTLSVLYTDGPATNYQAPLAGIFNTDMLNWGEGTGSYAFETIVHEIGHGLGLSHPHDDGGGSPKFPGVTSAFGDYGYHGQNQGINTIMSYNSGWADQVPPEYDAGRGFPKTPMALDIAAIQNIYGANTTYQNGDNIYNLSDYGPSNLMGWSSIWDTGGIDTITNEGSSVNAIINLNAADLEGDDAGGAPSYLSSRPHGFTIANGVVIENATGGDGFDLITGNDVSNILKGMDGDDTINGAGGYDVIDGGDGDDIAKFNNTRDSYTIVAHNGVVGVLSTTSDGSDKVTNVETLDFSDSAMQSDQAADFAIRGYMASNKDLLDHFGLNSDLIFDHYIQYGFAEDRQTDSFNGLEYIASNDDLIDAFGTNAAQALDHYIDYGYSEGRGITFDALEYIASHQDLMDAYGTDTQSGVEHYINYGKAEGRTATFEGLEYIASYTDLMASFGVDSDAGVTHYLTTGHAQNRSVTFSGMEYIASYADLSAAFGADAEQGAYHYIQHGRTEGRGTTFNGLEYIASNDDLRAAYGADAESGAEHYILYGAAEGRAITFDALAYIASYTDLIEAFGVDENLGASHYLQYGAAEGRAATFDVQAYLDANPQFEDNAEAALNYYINIGYMEG